MPTLRELSNRVKPLKRRARLYRIALQIASRFEAYLIDLNQLQLSQGKDIFGQVVGTYSEATEAIASQEFTRQPKVAGRPYNFEWTGELFDGMKVKFTNSYIMIFSTAPHADEVVAKFSGAFSERSLFGLSDEHLKEFVSEKILPDFKKEILDAIGP